MHIAMSSNPTPIASHRMAMFLEDLPTTSTFQPCFNKNVQPGINVFSMPYQFFTNCIAKKALFTIKKFMLFEMKN